MPATSPAAITVESLDIKNYKPAPRLSRETEAFTATIYINGRKAGAVSNDGGGGSNLYEFVDRAHAAAFRAYTEAWGTEHNERFDPADALILELTEAITLRKEARKLLKPWGAVAKCVIFIERGPYTITDDGPTYYSDSFLQVVTAQQDPEQVATEAGAERWRTIEV